MVSTDWRSVGPVSWSKPYSQPRFWLSWTDSLLPGSLVLSDMVGLDSLGQSNQICVLPLPLSSLPS